jgi:hypothetical protein
MPGFVEEGHKFPSDCEFSEKREGSLNVLNGIMDLPLPKENPGNAP